MLSDITNGGSWCPYCSSPPQKLCDKKDCKECKEKSFASSDKAQYWSEENKKEPRQVFKSSNNKYKFDCNKCKHTFESALSSITTGTWCPKCKNKTELKLLNHLKPLFPDVKTQCRFEWCKNILCLPFDFEIPSLKILIELDGPQHFKQISNWKSPQDQNITDRFKISKAIENKYSIIHILQEDVLFDKNEWKELLSTELIKHEIPDLILIGENNDLHIHFTEITEITLSP